MIYVNGSHRPGTIVPILLVASLIAWIGICIGIYQFMLVNHIVLPYPW